VIASRVGEIAELPTGCEPMCMNSQGLGTIAIGPRSPRRHRRGSPSAAIFFGQFTVSRPTAARAGESTAAEYRFRAIKKTKRFGEKVCRNRSWHSRVHFLKGQILGLGVVPKRAMPQAFGSRAARRIGAKHSSRGHRWTKMIGSENDRELAARSHT